MGKSRWIVFTDLDGTLLDRKSYSWEKAEAAIGLLKKNGIPIVFCSSKTLAEQAYYQRQMGIEHPMIVENGSAIMFPKNYFPGQILPPHRDRGDWLAIQMGIDADTLRNKLERVRQRTGLRFRGYSELSDGQLAELTGLRGAAIDRARQRDYSETIETDFDDAENQRFYRALHEEDLICVSGGHLLTVTSSANSKGKAVEMLIGLYRKRDGTVASVGLGDSPNDRSLLEQVDVAYQVQRPEGGWHDLQLANIHRVGIGPQGWQEAISSMLAAPAH